MVQLQSKLSPIGATCIEYVHPWTQSCLEAVLGCYLHGIVDSFRIYCTVYLLALLMRGKIPTLQDLKRTLYGIVQSTAFLSATAFGYCLFLCTLRRLLGHFNILTASGIPAFLSSVFAILIERPSRRLLLCLYVSNVATETLWNMALSRNLVRPLKYGQVAIFSTAMAVLLAFYRKGLHKKSEDDRSDSMFGVLKFVVGPYEEKDYTERSRQAGTFYRQQVAPNNSTNQRASWSTSGSGAKNTVYHLVTQALRSYKRLIHKIKCLDRHQMCPHPFSCLFYTLQGAGKMFGVGLAIQVALKLVLNMKKIVNSPKAAKNVFFKKDVLSLATFLGGFSGTFRGISCILRRWTGKDSPYYAIPAGLFAGLAFMQYPDTTVALYVLWKMMQISYDLGIERGIVPKIPGFTILLYCFSTATLFHAALLEPMNLRTSYWKFLHSMSGGRIACMDRLPLDVWGLNTSGQLMQVLKKTHTKPIVQFYGNCACS